MYIYLIILYVFVYMYVCGADPQALHGWGEWLSLGIPSMLVMCIEWWAYEIITILAGLLPDPKTSLGANLV